MKKMLFLLLAIMCFTGASVSAQSADRGKSNYKSLNGTSVEADLKSNPNFRVNEMKLDAADIENKAQLIKLRFDSSKQIIRLQDNELIEDDAPATGLPEGYKSYTRGPVEWIEDLKKGIVIIVYYRF